MPTLNEVLAVILGGGRGSRLYPLTKMRAKPAVPIAGKYRLIDIPISNCINAGILRVHVLTQFNSVSLHRHIAETYKFDAFHTGWVQILAAEQTMESASWYQGTADAVRKQLTEIRAAGAEQVLILAGDHLYRMDYAAMVAFHAQARADITVAVQPVAREDATRFGLLRCEADGRITDFAEKPKDAGTQARFACREDAARPFLGSMGIYLFRTEVLLDLLTRHPDWDDFGSDILPGSLGGRRVYGYGFEGFWEDIGTIRSFYDANLRLACADSPFTFYDPKRPIYTHSRFLPGSTVTDSRLQDVLLSEGCVVRGADLSRAVVGLRCQVGPGSVVRDSILMGADYYRAFEDEVPLGVGPGCHIEGAILDKNVRIGEGVVIRPFPKGTELDAGAYVVQDGIVVVPKGTILPPGTRIGPEA